MYIALYISSHGFGHMTRCLSIIENILRNSGYKIYIACDKKQNDFAKIYLAKYKDKIIFKDLVTDIGLVNKQNSLEVDKFSLEKSLIDFTSTWQKVVDEEYKFLKNLNLKCIVSDISPIGCIVGNRLNLPVVLISNFTWVEQYEYINIDKSIIDKYREAYSYVTKFISYDLSLDINCIDTYDTHNVGFICREIDNQRVSEIKSKYNKSIMITCGKSANLTSINITNFSGIIFTTSGIEINCEDNCKIVNLPIDTLDTQNYIAASDIVISKAGWGTIAEGIIGHTNLVLIERDSTKEDSFNINKLKENNLCISISEQKLSSIDIKEIKKTLNDNIDYKKLNKYKNDVNKIVDCII